jgi:hypothetical protein
VRPNENYSDWGRRYSEKPRQANYKKPTPSENRQSIKFGIKEVTVSTANRCNILSQKHLNSLSAAAGTDNQDGRCKVYH